MDPSDRSFPFAVPLAYAMVYLVWGSTYLAIRFGVESMPPFLMAAVRFAVAGLLLYVACRAFGAPRPTRREWRDAAIAGSLMLLGGNGLVTWAEQWVPSGLAALLVAVMPLWMAGMIWATDPTARPRARAMVGILLGFAGVAWLVNPGGAAVTSRMVFLGSLSIVAASGLWAAGSLYSRRASRPSHPLLPTAMQMLAGSAALFVTATLGGEWSRLDPGAITARSALALAYLIVFGSIGAFSAYVWLLRVSTPAKVSTYAYVNPIVAVFLGWALAGEAVGVGTLAAAAVIVASVALITMDRPRLPLPLPSSLTPEPPGEEPATGAFGAPADPRARRP